MRYGVKTEAGHLFQDVEPNFVRGCDVLVIGAGTAGTIAAIRAARSGARVCVVERLSFAGGMSTGAVFGYYYGARGGLYEEIDLRAREIERDGTTFERDRGMNRIARILALDEAFGQCGVDVLYETFVEGVFVEGRRIVGVRCAGHGREMDVGCEFAVDGTSEAFLCTLAGCETSMGREWDGRTQPFSYVSLSCDAEGGAVRGSNSDFGYVDAGDGPALSRSVLASAADIRPAVGVPLGVASVLGAREGRRIRGVDEVSWKDFLEKVPARRPVTFSISNMDDHGKDMAFESQAHADWMVGMSMWGTTVRLKVPMGSLIPVEYDNVCVAGRHLCMDHDCSSQLRMMRDLQRVGEAAGEIAAVSVRKGVPAAEAPYDEIMKPLLASNCFSEPEESDVWDTKPQGGAVAYPKSDEEMWELLSGDKPGLGMLYALRERRLPLVRSQMPDGDDWLAFNAAATLALGGDSAGAQVLLRALRLRDRRMFATSRKFNMTRGIAALYLLGRLAHPCCEEECRKIWMEDALLVKYSVAPDEFFAHPEDTRFAYLSHGARALLNLADRDEARRESIDAFLLERAFRPDFRTWYSLKDGGNLPWDATEDLRGYLRWRIASR